MSTNHLRAVQPTYRVLTETGYETFDCSAPPVAADSTTQLACYNSRGTPLHPVVDSSKYPPGTPQYATACTAAGGAVTCPAAHEGGSCATIRETQIVQACKNAMSTVNLTGGSSGTGTCADTGNPACKPSDPTGCSWFKDLPADCCGGKGLNTNCNPCANSTVMTPINCGYAGDPSKVPYVCAPAVAPSTCGANTNPTLSKGQWFWDMNASGCETSAAGKGSCECFKPFVQDPTDKTSCILVTGLKKQDSGKAYDYPLPVGSGAQWNYTAGTCHYNDGSTKAGYLTEWDICGKMGQACLGSNSFWSSEISKSDMDEYCERATGKIGATASVATVCVEGYAKYTGDGDTSGTLCSKPAEAYYCPGDPKPQSLCILTHSNGGGCPWPDSGKSCL